MKRTCIILFLLSILLISSLAISQETDGKIEEYAETTGIYLLKLQNLILGFLAMISFGEIAGEPMAFVQFLFAIMLFMIFYTSLGIVKVFSTKIQFLVSLIVMLLVFLSTDKFYLAILNYKSMGIVITVVLPVLILLSFTFRIYQRAYEGESNTSPFYAEVFNLLFLIFFGIFFIRYSKAEEGVIALMRLISGWILIALGIGQFFLYKPLAYIFHIWNIKDENKERDKMLKEASEEIESMKAKDLFSYSKDMRRGGAGNKGGRFVKRASTERYSRRFGVEAAKKRFG